MKIASFPSNFAELDSVGRRVVVGVFRKRAIKFWDDAVDRHVKILNMHFADRTE